MNTLRTAALAAALLAANAGYATEPLPGCGPAVEPAGEGESGARQLGEAMERTMCLYMRSSALDAVRQAYRQSLPAMRAHQAAKARMQGIEGSLKAMIAQFWSPEVADQVLRARGGLAHEDRSRYGGGRNDGDPRPEQRVAASQAIEGIVASLEDGRRAGFLEAARASARAGAQPTPRGPDQPPKAPLHGPPAKYPTGTTDLAVAYASRASLQLRNSPILREIVQKAVTGRCPSSSLKGDLPYPCGHGTNAGVPVHAPGSHDPYKPDKEAERASMTVWSRLVRGAWGGPSRELKGKAFHELRCRFQRKGHPVVEGQRQGAGVACDYAMIAPSSAPRWLHAFKAERDAATRTEGWQGDRPAWLEPRGVRPSTRIARRVKMGLEPQWQRYARGGEGGEGRYAAELLDEIGRQGTQRSEVEAAIAGMLEVAQGAENGAERAACLAAALRGCLSEPDVVPGEDPSHAQLPVVSREPWLAPTRQPMCAQRGMASGGGCGALVEE